MSDPDTAEYDRAKVVPYEDRYVGVDVLAWLDKQIAWDKAHPIRYRLRRVRHHLGHPVKAYRSAIYWPVRTFWERGRKGVGISDTWGLDTYISKVMAEGIARLRADAHGYPMTLTEGEWDSVLAEMEQGFRRWSAHWDDPDEDEAYRQVRRSIRLMHRWFGHLWD